MLKPLKFNIYFIAEQNNRSENKMKGRMVRQLTLNRTSSNRTSSIFATLSICCGIIAGCGPKQEPYGNSDDETSKLPYVDTDDIFTDAADLGRGVNLAHWKEAPADEDWGATITEADFFIIADAGFDTVRFPIRWEGRTEEDAPNRISEDFFEVVDDHVAWANASGLNLVIDMHHHQELFDHPYAQLPRFLAMWRQIARRYAREGNNIYFELMNEPHGGLTPELWNEFAALGVAAIRESNATRPIIIDTANWGGLEALTQLEMPDDSKVIMSFHYYAPYEFTHQGAEWAAESESWLGTEWTGTYLEKLQLYNDVSAAAAWAKENNVPVWVGEFGTIDYADMASRTRWAETFCRFAEDAGFTWAYWDYSANFGLYDTETDQWHEELLLGIMNDNFSVTALSADELGEDLLAGANGDFSDVFADWGRNTPGNSIRVEDETLNIFVTDPKEELWEVQVYHLLPPLEEGKSYAVLFEAKADKMRTIGISIQNFTEEGNWENYGSSNAILGTEWMPYVARVTMDKTDQNAAVTFNVGKEISTVYLDNVQLFELTE